MKPPESLLTCSRNRCHWRNCRLPDPHIPWPSRTVRNRYNSIYAEMSNLRWSYHKQTNKQTNNAEVQIHKNPPTHLLTIEDRQSDERITSDMKGPYNIDMFYPSGERGDETKSTNG